MATTRYGLTGPMTAYGAFQAKEAGVQSTNLKLMGVGISIFLALSHYFFTLGTAK